jgi:hypothetical protein
MAAPSQAAAQNIWAEADAAARAESMVKIVRLDALDLRVLP